MDKIAVLIPCYNEEKTIEKVVKDFRAVIEKYGDDGDCRVYVYDNNSTDKTAFLARAAGAVVRHEYKQGKGNVVRRMFREIDARCYVIADGDDTYPAESAKAMIDAVLERQADMVVGDRLSSTYFGENKRPFHNFGNVLVRKSINFLFKSDIKDIMTGYRAFSYQFVKSFPVLSNGFEIETEMSIHAIDKNVNIVNTVVDYKDRPEGSVSKLNTYSDGFKVLCTIWKLFRHIRPLRFFGTLAIILGLISIGFFVPILVEFIKTGLVRRFPTLIICGFTMIAAIQSFFAGLILENIKDNNREYFELELIRLHELYSRKSKEE